MTAINNSINTENISNQEIEALKTDVELDPTDLVAKISLANTLERTGKTNEAKSLYQEVIEADSNGSMGAIARKALDSLNTTTITPVEQLNQELKYRGLPLVEKPEKQGISPLNWLRQSWDNLSFRRKLAILLMASAALPVITVTQVLSSIGKQQDLAELKKSLQKDGQAFTQEYVLWTQVDSETKANSLAQLIQASNINLSNPSDVSVRKEFLSNFIKIENGAEPETNKNFQIFTDAKGKTVAQDIKILVDSYGNNPPLPAKNSALIEPKYRSVSLPTGIDLGNIPIVKNALKTGQPLSGMELLKQESLQRLGLEKQANIGIKAQPTKNLPEPKQPFPGGTYDIDGGKVGLVSMAVHPIKINNKLVGTVIIGAVQNRSYTLVDKFSQNYNIPVATVFAQDWRITTNVPYSDAQTRAIGTRVAREVAEKVLNQGQDFNGQTNIVGRNYLTYYSPLYDHQKLLNPTQAKPVGISFIGQSLEEIESDLNKQHLIAYSIGGGILLLVGVIAIPLASSFARPLRRLSMFAKQVAGGEQGIRLESTKRHDEIGVLSHELNQMAASIEANLEAVRSQEELSRQEAERQRQEKERLQKGVIDLLLDIEGAQRGDLTVRAKVVESEMGSIADAFNATIHSLNEIVTQVKTATNQVQESTFTSEESVEKLTQEAVTQTKVVTEALNSVEQITQSIQSVANSAQEAAAIATKGLTAAQNGGEVMDQTVGSIENIRASVAETAKKIKRLAESSQEISKIVSIISGISEKTNLLAFNASIEASRAGENGQGFRVVADEVRRLAERVTDSTKEIEQLVNSIQQETAEVLQTMEASTTHVVTGTKLVARTKNTLQGLANINQKIDQLLASISATTVSQAQASQMVNQTMQEVAAIAQNNSTESEAVATSLQQLVTVANNLQSSVSRFRVEK